MSTAYRDSVQGKQVWEREHGGSGNILGRADSRAHTHA